MLIFNVLRKLVFFFKKNKPVFNLVYKYSDLVRKPFFLASLMISILFFFQTGSGNSVFLFTWYGSLIKPEGTPT